MPFLLAVLVAGSVLTPVHLFAIAGVARAFGVGVREVSLGYGPVVGRVGKVTLRALLPLGGSCRFVTDEPVVEWVQTAPTHAAFASRPRLVRAAIPLAGPVAVAVLGCALAGPAVTVRAVGSGFGQVLLGGIGPLSTAQGYLQAGAETLATDGFVGFAGVVAAKLAATNLLPLPLLNGGQALDALLRPDGEEWERRAERLAQWLLLPQVLLAASWFLAIALYAVAR